ncbi:protein of unknown function DUF4218 [Abeliophyllum distichum]|uniref:DUF4218 domain-containing protein n=1 Tax=Abeliophyllum distichum TaxID=126358 RepID=A0ABD1Q4M4_9LAMI
MNLCASLLQHYDSLCNASTRGGNPWSLVHIRWMYLFKRYLKKQKDYVRNRARSEGSIAEGYVVDEEGNGAGDPSPQPPCRLDSAFRFTVRPYHPSWTKAPEEQWARLRNIIESYFDLQYDESPDEYRVVCAAIDCLVTDRYCDYKLKTHNHFKKHGPSRLYESTKNKVNRSKAKYPSVQESNNFSATCYGQRDPAAQQCPGIIESFRTFHTFRNSNWVNPEAAGD